MVLPLQSRLPYDHRVERPLPGVRPLDMSEWLCRDEAFEDQMALRDQLIRDKPGAVLALDPSGQEAAEELLDMILGQIYPLAGTYAARPDGVAVDIRRDDPMRTLGRLVQEDLCLLQKSGDEHVLTGAALCFPASWSLDEKFMRPLTTIHAPVASYDDGIARRVQRLFDGLQVGRPIWRFNRLWYRDPDLHQPRRMADRRDGQTYETGDYLRSERQCLVRLPETRAIVFSIHTYVVPRSAVEFGAGGG